MGFSFLVTLREGVEMALIIAILLGYLRSVGERRHYLQVWAGVAVAAVVCVAVGVILEVMSRELDKRFVEAFEGFTMIFAVIVLTGMAFWMKRQARGISAGLRAGVDKALSRGSVAAIVLLAASAVGREGLETTLFLFAGSTTSASGFDFVLGGVLGFAVAAAIGAVIYYGAARFPLRLFFQLSGVTILIIAAGLLSTAMVKLYEAAIITNLGHRPWDTDHVVSITSNLGKFLSTLVGYDSAPAMLQIVLYWSYLVLALAAFLFWPTSPRTRPATTSLPGAPDPTSS